MNNSNKPCNLNCVKDKGKSDVVEFVGPVKIVLVDPPLKIYRRRVWGAAVIVLAQMMMGATTMTVLFYALSYQTRFAVALHVFLCTVGFQLCMPTGILSLNKQSGSAAPMRIPDRVFEHVFIQFMGVGLALGSVIVLCCTDIFSKITMHGLLGFVTSAATALNLITGLLLYVYFGKKQGTEKFGKASLIMVYIHRILGTISFTSSSLCFVLGIARPSFEKWVPVPAMVGVLFLFCIFYTAVVLYRPLKKLMKKVF